MKNASSAAIVKFLLWTILSRARMRNSTALIAMTTTSQHDVMDAVVYLGQVSVNMASSNRKYRYEIS